MNEKIKTSIQYQLTNVRMFKNIFQNWEEFNKVLSSGPDNMKAYLYNQWNDVRNKLKDNDKISLNDVNKVVTINDFDVTFNKTKNGTPVFFMTFPDYEYVDAASKYIALALTKEMPRFFTLEYSEKFATKEKCWVIGEFCIKDGKVRHMNYGETDNMRLSWFAGYILGKLESENM